MILANILAAFVHLLEYSTVSLTTFLQASNLDVELPSFELEATGWLFTAKLIALRAPGFLSSF